MEGDSEIKEFISEKPIQEISGIEELVHATKSSLLYRIRKDGKYFLLKRSAIEGLRGQHILRREYEISVGCNHPNIIDVYEFRKISEIEYELVMEYVEGRTLADFLKENPSLKTKKRIFSELLDAVGYLHQRRIIHNDLKPDNVLISRIGNHVKLIDLGLSDDDAHYELKTLGFSEDFAAPELSRYRKSDVRSDIYSLGVIMRWLFGGRYIFVIHKCLKKNPARRFHDIISLKKSWKRTEITRGIPFLLIFILLISLGIIIFIQNNKEQRQKLEELQAAISTMPNKPDFRQETMENEISVATAPDDSFIEKETKPGSPQYENKKIIEDFRKAYKMLSSETVDSLGKCEYSSDMIEIFRNYSLKAKELYERAMEQASNESDKTVITSIMMQQSANVDKDFQKFLNTVVKREREELEELWNEE